MANKPSIRQINVSSIPDGKIIKTSGGTFVFTNEVTGVVDGDKGDITISNTGQTYTIDQKAVTFGKIQDTLNTSILIGRYDPAGGTIQEIMIGTGLMLTGDTLVSTAAFYGSGGTSGEINTASNLGTGIGLYSTKVGSDLRFKSLMAGPNIILSGNSTMIIISGSPSGEINTASNVGTGVELFKQKNGFDLEFKTISGTPNQITVISGNSVIRLALPQDLNTQSTPTFELLNIGTGSTKTTYGKENIDIIGVNTFQINNNDGGFEFGTGGIGGFKILELAGLNNRMVIANSGGTLLTQSINIGDITGATNLGTGFEVFSNKSGADFRFRTLSGTPNQINISSGSSLLTLGLPQDIAPTSSPFFNNITGSGTISGNSIIANRRITASAFTSTVSTGTQPIVVSSTTVVINLNADMVDSIQGSDLVTGGTALDGGINIFTNKTGANLLFRGITGRTNQINISASTDLITFSLPQDIGGSSSPSFLNVNASNIVTTGGNQTISGIKTFVSNITIPDASAATDGMNRQSSDARYLKNTYDDFYPTLWPYTGATGVVTTTGWTKIAKRINSSGRGMAIVTLFSNTAPGNASVQLYWGNSNTSVTGELRIIGGHGTITGINSGGVELAFRSITEIDDASFLEINVAAASTGTPRTYYSQVQSLGLNTHRTEPVNFILSDNTGTTVAVIPYSAFRVKQFQINHNGSIITPFNITASGLTSTVITGRPPIIISSTTVVTNLNADMIDSIQGNQLITGGTNLGGGIQIFSGNTQYNLNFRTLYGDPTIQISADTTTATVMYKPIIIVTGDSPTGIYPDGAIWIQI